MDTPDFELDDLPVRMVDVDWLKPAPNNNKDHTPATTAKLARSMEKLGQITPVICDKEGVLIAGHGRALAAKELGWPKIKCVILPVDAETARKMRIADNLVSNQAYNQDALLKELADLGIAGEESLSELVADDRMVDNLLTAMDPIAEMDRDSIVTDIETAVSEYAEETDEHMHEVEEKDVAIKAIFEFGKLKPREARRLNVFMAMLKGKHGNDAKEALLAHAEEVIANG
ncbi:MAG: ParB N-terminal domain-containing protein [Mameliella sp.]|nr:ParB N-terminal domain-containing protein [Mameliella sp.]